MKKLIYISLAAICLLATSCNDEFLEKYPQTSLTEQNSFLEYNGFRAYMNPCYNLFFDTAIRTNFNTMHCGSQFYSDFYAGILTNRDNPTGNGYAYRTITPTTTGGGWDFSYIRRINIMLSHVQDGVLNDKDAAHWEAVGRFFRAWWYMELVDRFGDVPWIDKVLSDTSEEIMAPRTARATVVENICKDFEFAIDNIGDSSKDGSNPLTQNACRAAYSRFLLREGTWAKYHNLKDEKANDLLDKCIAVSATLMEAYPTLYKGVDDKNPGTGYGELWTTESLIGVPGVIFSQEYVDAIKMHRGNDYEHIAAHYTDVPQHTMDMFLMKNGKPVANPASGYKGGKGTDIYAEFQDRDPRLYLNVQPPYAVVANSGPGDGKESFPTWRYAKAGDKIQATNYVVKDDAEAAKFRQFIDMMGANEQCVRGGAFGGKGMKRCPGQNWGAALTPSSPNLSNSGSVAYMKSRTGYYFWKNYDMWEYATGSSAFCTADKPIFKIEEVLLNYAEAMFERGQFNQGVADKTINLLRRRVGMADMNLQEIDGNFDPARDNGEAKWLTGSLSKYAVAPVLWEIRRERMVELFGEGFGFYDVRRWGKADYYINRQPCGMYIASTSIPCGNGTFSGQVVDYEAIKSEGKASASGNEGGWIYTAASPLEQGGGWIDTYYLMMVPTNEIVLNPKLTQNPGYNDLFGIK